MSQTIDLSAGRIDFKWVRGDSQIFRVIPKEIDTAHVIEASFTVRKSAREPTIAVQKTLGNGVKRTDDGEFYFYVEAGDTAALPAARYSYDIEFRVELGGGEVWVDTPMSGVLELMQDVTY